MCSFGPVATYASRSLAPDGERKVSYDLRKLGTNAELDYYESENHTFRGLPCGDYVLHIRGSGELQSDDPEFADAAPAKMEYAGRDIPFTISENSPPLIDLGKIDLEPVRP